MPRLLAFPAALSGLVFAALASTAAAAPSPAGARFRSPAAGAVLEPGASVSVAWEELELSAGEAEMELLLSLDGGRSFPVRLTRDLSPGTASLSWRVPALPARSARLAIRAGGDEEPENERIAAVSGEFEIAEGSGGGLETVHFVRGEWRTGAALDGAAPPELPSGLASDGQNALRALPRSIPFAGVRRGAGIAAAATSSRRIDSCPAPHLTPAASDSSLPPPAVPLRL